MPCCALFLTPPEVRAFPLARVGFRPPARFTPGVPPSSPGQAHRFGARRRNRAVSRRSPKGGADQPRLLSRPSLFGNYVPRSHHEGAACINLRSQTKNLLTREPLRHQGRINQLHWFRHIFYKKRIFNNAYHRSLKVGPTSRTYYHNQVCSGTTSPGHTTRAPPVSTSGLEPKNLLVQRDKRVNHCTTKADVTIRRSSPCWFSRCSTYYLNWYVI